MSQRIAVVTGANKGIGYAIVKDLAPKFDGLVYLTSRNPDLGRRAFEDLKKLGLDNVRYHQLDIDNQESIERFAKYIKETYQGLDVLINNAAIAYKIADKTPFSEQARNTIRVNFTGTLNLCNALFPLLRPHARVVVVSSRAGLLKHVKSEELRKKFTHENATVQDIVHLLEEFVKAAQTGTHESLGYPNTAYGTSKVGLNALTKIFQRQFCKDPREDLIINSLCPGYVATDMTSWKGFLTPEQGAETPIHLALIPKNAPSPKGEFWAEMNPVNWKDTSYKTYNS